MTHELEALVQPRGGNVVLNEVRRLHHLDNVLGGGADVAADRKLFEGHDHVLASRFTVVPFQRERETKNEVK